MPFTKETWAEFNDDVDALIEDHPLSTLPDTKNLDPHVWQKESFEIVSTFMYEGIHENEELP